MTNIKDQKDFNIKIMVADHLNISWRDVESVVINEMDDSIYVQFNDEVGYQQAYLPIWVIQDQPESDGIYRVNLSGQSVKTYQVDIVENPGNTEVILKDYYNGSLAYVLTYEGDRVVKTYSAKHDKSYKTRFLNVKFQNVDYKYFPPLKGNTRIG